MAYREDMNWQPSYTDSKGVKQSAQWHRYTDGKRIKVTPFKLIKLGFCQPGTQDTREATREGANRFWADYSSRQALSSESARRMAWARANGRHEILDARVRKISTLPAKVIKQIEEHFFPNGEVDRDFDAATGLRFHFMELQEKSRTEEAVWEERLSGDTTATIPAELTIGQKVTEYLQTPVVLNGKHATRTMYSRQLTKLVNHYGTETPISSLSKPLAWSGYFAHIEASGLGRIERGKAIGYARGFIHWLADDCGLITLPSNLNSRTLQHKKEDDGDMEEKLLTVEQVKILLARSEGVVRLAILLGLNAGLTQADVAYLEPKNVVGGKLKNVRRKKTGVVNINPLWVETLEALRQNPLPLRWKDGSRLVDTGDTSGKRIDHLRDSLRGCEKVYGFKWSWKQLRTTSANLIGNDRNFGERIRDIWRAEKAKGIGNRSYDWRQSPETQTQLQEAVEMLHRVYFECE